MERHTREERAQTLAVNHTVDGGSRSEPFDPHDSAHGQSFEEVAPQYARADGSAMQERVQQGGQRALRLAGFGTQAFVLRVGGLFLRHFLG